MTPPIAAPTVSPAAKAPAMPTASPSGTPMLPSPADAEMNSSQPPPRLPLMTNDRKNAMGTTAMTPIVAKPAMWGDLRPRRWDLDSPDYAQALDLSTGSGVVNGDRRRYVRWR